MEPPASPIVYRKRILTDPAAEFIERRGTFEILAQLTNSSEEAHNLDERTEFVSELHGFALKGTVFDPTVYYEDSKKTVAKFRDTLNAFVSLIKERGVEEELGILIKDPSDEGFTVDYALSVVAKIDEGPPNRSSPAKRCKSFIRKCYRKVEDNRDTINMILSMVPDDIYGSVISGGFSIILAAVEKHAEEREAIQKCLAEIPEKFEKMQRLSDIHRASRRLHACIDAVIVSIFSVLERIVNQLTYTWTYRTKKKTAALKSMLKKKSKALNHDVVSPDNAESSKEPRDESTVADALADLETRIKQFEEEVSMCGEEMLGRIERGTQDTGLNVKSLAKDTKVVKDSLAWMISKGLHKPQKAHEALGDELLIKMQDNLHIFLVSHPLLTTVLSQAAGFVQLPPPGPAPEPPSSREEIRKRNKRLVKSWLSDLDTFQHDPRPDVKDCLAHMEQLSLDEKNICQFNIASTELADWLTSYDSKTLIIDLKTTASSLVNPLSVTSALLVGALRSNPGFPVLGFFSMHRTNTSALEKHSGPLGLVKSLNAQLMKFIRGHRTEMDLSLLDDKKLLGKKSRTDLAAGLALFEALVLLLPEGDTLYIILDCYSNLTGSEKEADKVLKRLDKIIRRARDMNSVDIKLLITDPLVGSLAWEMKNVENLHVPDLVEGCGAVDDEEIAKMARKGRKKKQKTRTRGKEEEDSETETEEGSETETEDDTD